ncbi:baseplate assembly protein [Asticcacaulis endophyticus]|nr:baseplate J/gp47 family protein [Asticcacaulis endophyticus]
MSDATFNAIDLSRLPAPDVIEALSFEAIYAEMLAALKVYIPDFDDLLESDPAVRILQVCAYFRMIDRQRINDAAKAVMVAYALGADLDQLGVIFGVRRLEITPADVEAGTAAVMESDDEFRERILLAPEGYSVAGPVGAYIFHAKSADADVADASVISPDPGEVLVTILSRSANGAASPELIATVSAALSDETVRPLTDFVTIQAATLTTWQIVADITTYAGPDAAVVIAQGRTNAEALIARQYRLGMRPTRSAIIAALHVEGVQNVVLTSPAADIVIGPTEASRCTMITLNHDGVV